MRINVKLKVITICLILSSIINITLYIKIENLRNVNVSKTLNDIDLLKNYFYETNQLIVKLKQDKNINNFKSELGKNSIIPNTILDSIFHENPDLGYSKHISDIYAYFEKCNNFLYDTREILSNEDIIKLNNIESQYIKMNLVITKFLNLYRKDRHSIYKMIDELFAIIEQQ